MSNKKLVIIIISAIAILGIIIAMALLFKQQAEDKIAKQEAPLIGEEYIDPVSGEAVTKSTRKHDSADKSITMLGFTGLINAGLGMDQYRQLEDKFTILGGRLSANITQVSMYKDSAENTYVDEGETRIRVFNFKMQINQKDDYTATIKYTSLDRMTLEVYKPDQTTPLYTL